MYPTIAEVLTLPVIRDGSPRLVAGLAGSGHRVRWVHAAEVAEAVISLIWDAQLAELRAAEQVHETFTALTVAGAGPADLYGPHGRYWYNGGWNLSAVAATLVGGVPAAGGAYSAPGQGPFRREA